MISYLKGFLAKKEPVNVIIDCGGVGYEVNIPLSTFDKLPSINKEIKLHIHYSFNEMDGVRLFGFFTLDEKELFRQLISISKVGPKIALSVLSALSVQDMIRAVQSGDIGLISTVPGIGKKSAERLIIELKDKVGSILTETILKVAGSVEPDIVREAESALITLGYKPYEIRKKISELLKDQKLESTEEIIKATIKSLYKKRNI